MRQSGKKIDTWKIYAGGNRWSVEVRMIPDGRGFKFVAECKAQDRRWEGKDISALKREVVVELENARAIQWEDFYLAEFTADCPDTAEAGTEHKEYSVSSRFEYQRIQVGTRGDGSKCHRRLRRWDDDGPSWSDAWNGEPEVGVENSWQGGPESTALLPATPEVFAALEALRLAFADLHKRLYDLLHPDRAAKNLLAMRTSGVRLLEAPQAKKARKGKVTT